MNRISWNINRVTFLLYYSDHVGLYLLYLFGPIMLATQAARSQAWTCLALRAAHIDTLRLYGITSRRTPISSLPTLQALCGYILASNEVQIISHKRRSTANVWRVDYRLADSDGFFEHRTAKIESSSVWDISCTIMSLMQIYEKDIYPVTKANHRIICSFNYLPC